MQLVLDGYNILKKMITNKMVSQEQRALFIKQLQRYAAHKHHTIVIVFDGGPSCWPTQEQEKFVSIIYSGSKMSADDYIKQYVQNHRAHGLVLISTDRALQHFARQQGVSIIDSEEFINFFIQDPNSDKSALPAIDLIQKISPEINPELDTLMMTSSERIPPKQEDSPNYHTHKKHTLSKKEKKRQQLLKKL